MEELWNHPDFGDQKKLVEKLNLKPPKGITNLEDWWKEIHRARHAYHNGQRSNQMQTEELNVFKEFTRYSILAYVVWLKNNQ